MEPGLGEVQHKIWRSIFHSGLESGCENYTVAYFDKNNCRRLDKRLKNDFQKSSKTPPLCVEKRFKDLKKLSPNCM